MRGPNVFFEYWGNEAATREALHDGWFRTGDIAARDADGYFYVHDRKKNMIISGGENIYAAEIERVLLEHPAVADCGVIGRPDPKWDEVPVAYVIRRAGARRRAEDLPRTCWRNSRASRCRANSCLSTICRAPRSARCSISSCRRVDETAGRRKDDVVIENHRSRRRQRLVRGGGRFRVAGP